MSAQLDSLPRYRRMTGADLEAVLRIEDAVYPHPWTRGNFSDSLVAGYHCWVVECAGDLAGYSVVMIAAGEGHLLNLSVAVEWQRRGIGSQLLAFVTKLARDYGAQRLLLEVRPTNHAALALYAAAGFSRVALRRGYYPAGDRREDAIVLQRELHQVTGDK
jgi:[ribosomal protein S18]-alanine N-acetyltransferase